MILNYVSIDKYVSALLELPRVIVLTIVSFLVREVFLRKKKNLLGSILTISTFIFNIKHVKTINLACDFYLKNIQSDQSINFKYGFIKFSKQILLT